MSIYQGNKKVLGGVSNIEENKVKEIIDSERPITTTIDSTSTDMQVPSAKSVYNVTSQFLKTYTSFEQLGLTGGSETIEDIANNMGDCTRLIVIIGENISNASIYPYINGTLIVEKLNIYRVHFKFCIDGSPLVYVGNYHTISGFTGWSRLCSTKLGDVPLTNITIPTNMFNSYTPSTSFIRYEVKNGIAYIYISIRKADFKTTGTSFDVSVPKSTTKLEHIVASENTSSCISLIVQDGQMKMWCIGSTNTTNYLATFSYPVAES